MPDTASALAVGCTRVASGIAVNEGKIKCNVTENGDKVGQGIQRTFCSPGASILDSPKAVLQ